MLRIITINLIILACLLAVLELIFGTWFSDAHALHQFTKPRNIALEQPNPLKGPPATVHYTRDANGFRGLNGALSDIDLLTVGGSTTDQRYLDDTATFQAQLTDLFAAEGRDIVIANAGIDGQSTFGHIENFNAWFHRLDTLEPRYILYYVGINDALIVSSKPEFDRVEAAGKLLRIQLFIREKSAFYQLYLIAKQALRPPLENHQVSHANFAIPGTGLTDTPTLAPGALETPGVTRALDTLRGNIHTLAKLTRGMGAEPIFVTQRSTAWTRKDGKILGTSDISPGFLNRYTARFGPINGVDIHTIETHIADTILGACHAEGAICFDLMHEAKFDLARDFYDSVHTNSTGASVIAAYLHRKLSALDGF